MAGHDGVGQVVQGSHAGPLGEGGRKAGNTYVESLAPTLHYAVAVEGQDLARAEDQLVLGQSGRRERRGTERGR
jgi:hypothetical protein